VKFIENIRKVNKNLYFKRTRREAVAKVAVYLRIKSGEMSERKDLEIVDGWKQNSF
jgi:hypothetical protein